LALAFWPVEQSTGEGSYGLYMPFGVLYLSGANNAPCHIYVQTTCGSGPITQTRQQCEDEASDNLQNSLQSIGNRSPFQSIFVSAVVGGVIGGSASCLGNPVLCEFTEGASSIPGAVTGASRGAATGAVGWTIKNMMDMNTAKTQFKQQVNNVCSKLPG
jgi:hypothetical protein